MTTELTTPPLDGEEAYRQAVGRVCSSTPPIRLTLKRPCPP
jgi:hypothetical protein